VTGRTVWLASYPKSGNTWVRAVHTALTTRQAPDLNALVGLAQPAGRGLLDEILGVPSSDLTRTEIDLLRPRVDEVVDARAERVMLRKVHDGCYPGPAGEPVVSVTAARAVLYVIRDPRDVAVSYAHHFDRPVEWAAARLCDPANTLAPGTRGVAPQVPQRLGDWSAHVLSWVDQPWLPVHVLRYEDALADPVRAFGAAFAAVGLLASDPASGPASDPAADPAADLAADFAADLAADLAAAVDACTFDRLAAAEAAAGFRERPRPDTPFFRRGQTGTWRDELPAPLADHLATAHHTVMTRFGYLP
jgi:aryl sulfotransferase